MDPAEDDALVFQYVEDEDGACLVTNMSDEQVAEILTQYLQRDTGETVH